MANRFRAVIRVKSRLPKVLSMCFSSFGTVREHRHAGLLREVKGKPDRGRAPLNLRKTFL